MGAPQPYGTEYNRSVPDAGTLQSIVNTPSSPAGTGVSTDPRPPALPTLGRIFVVKLSMAKLSESILGAACNIVKSELESLFKDRNGRLTGVFSVARGEPDGATPAGTKDFALYLLTKSDLEKARSVLKTYFPSASAAGLEKAFKDVVAQINAEGGATARSGATSVAFVAMDLYAAEAGEVPESEKDSLDRKKRVGIYLAGMMLHELGHSMGAGHDTGIMAPKEEIKTTGVPELHFSFNSKNQILRAFAPQRDTRPRPPARK